MNALRTLLLIGALLALAPPSFAVDAHHSDEATGSTPPAASPVPRQPGMMGSDTMSGGMMEMMSMMASMGQMMAPEHIEGRIAFLQAELAITEAQQPLWNAFADALRANARGMMDMTSAMPMATTEATLPQKVEREARLLATRLEGLRQIKAALQPLYAAFDDGQRQTADTLLTAMLMGVM